MISNWLGDEMISKKLEEQKKELDELKRTELELL